MPQIATNTRVEREELLDFVRTRHHLILVTTRSDGRPQLSPVTGGVDADGRIVVSTYPDRAKATNLRRDPRASVLVLSEEWDDAWVQVDGTTEVLDMFPHVASRLPRSAPPDANPRGGPEGTPNQEAEDGLVEYFRCISGEHPDWDDYRAAMRRQGKSLLRITPERWGPIATGGFPADRVPS
jgi:PPOX class probable F420-dependent enzyme